MCQHSSTCLCNARCAVHNRYKEVKQWELTWEQFLTEVTVINDEEAQWDSSKQNKHRKEIVVLSLIMGESMLSPAPRSKEMLSWIVLICFVRNWIFPRRNNKRGFGKEFTSAVVGRVTK